MRLRLMCASKSWRRVRGTTRGKEYGSVSEKRRRCDGSGVRRATSPSAAPAASGPSDAVIRLWKGCDAVCFDVDSTVCEDEGIDELASFLQKGDAVAAWTKKAMEGNVSFR